MGVPGGPELLIIGPNDELVRFVEYNDIAIPSESKLIPVSEPGEYVAYPIEMQGGFLSVNADVPVPSEQREGRILETQTETVVDGQAGPSSAGTGETCVPEVNPVAEPGCTTNTTWNGGASASFSADGTFPLEVVSWINEDGSNDANLDAEIRIKSENGLVHRSKKVVQYEDDRGTLGMSRDELNVISNWENLAKGEYTVDYVIDGSGTVGHTLKTYQR
jgi:hypothetical protein